MALQSALRVKKIAAQLNSKTDFAGIDVTNDANADRLTKKVLTFHKYIEILVNDADILLREMFGTNHFIKLKEI